MMFIHGKRGLGHHHAFVEITLAEIFHIFSRLGVDISYIIKCLLIVISIKTMACLAGMCLAQVFSSHLLQGLAMKFSKLILCALAVACNFSAQAVHAAYSLSFQNTTFTITQLDHDSFTLRIQNALNANGDWVDANYLDNLAFKNIGTGFSGATVTPGNWSYFTNELNAVGCAGGVSSGLCFDAAPAIALTNDMLFTIDVLGASLNFADSGPHLKLRFLELANGVRKEGSLLSQDLISDAPISDDQQVSEPNALVLLGLSMLGLGIVRRRQARF